MLFPNQRGEGDAVDFRHPDVEDDCVAGVKVEPTDDFGTVRKRRATVTFPAKEGSQEAIEEAIVVNNEEVHSDGPCVGLEIALSMPAKACAGEIVSAPGQSGK
jgi:hypothetical protein